MVDNSKYLFYIKENVFSYIDYATAVKVDVYVIRNCMVCYEIDLTTIAVNKNIIAYVIGYNE